MQFGDGGKMTRKDLEDEGYIVIRDRPVVGPRGAKKAIVLMRPWKGGRLASRLCISWSFDGKHYVDPVSLGG